MECAAEVPKENILLPQLIQELKDKVVQAANRLQSDLPIAAPSAEQLGTSSVAQPAPCDAAPSAEQSGTSSVAQPALCDDANVFDLDLAMQQFMDAIDDKRSKRQQRLEWRRETGMASRLKEASRLLAECRKYREKSWIAGEDELRMKNIIRQLQIILQPQCTREDWLELYKVSSDGQIIGPSTAV